MAVEYDSQETDRGPQARRIQVLSAAQGEDTSQQVADPQRQESDMPYRFLNPYNFVRSLEGRSVRNGSILDRVSPPPRDRYVGLSGRITCTLTATTPLFVSDSEGIEIESLEQGKEHLHYRFFRDPEGRIAIPGTSLRGAIRSVFEAATGSCLTHFESDKRLSYHLPPGEALKLVPARVDTGPNGIWSVELLPGMTAIAPGQRPSGPQYAAWAMVYRPLLRSRTVASSPRSAYSRRSPLPSNRFSNGQQVWALLERVEHPLRRFEFWNVLALADAKSGLPASAAGQKQVQGYLCITNQNIENKHDERFFFRDPANSSLSVPLPLKDDVRKRYEELITDYQERHADGVNKRIKQGKPADQPIGSEPAFSRFILERTRKTDAKLQAGDLVYAMLEQRGTDTEVRFLVPVSVPRVGYEHTIGELLYSQDMTFCQDAEHLCPACRTFGWVHPQAEQLDEQDSVAYAGRVRFSHAFRRQRGEDGEVCATLAILSTPKPTTTRFYVRPRQGKPRDGLPDEQVGYDGAGQMLRGRKFYRHQGEQLNAQEYASVGGQKSDQNRTAHDIQPAGTLFEFCVDFENLTPVELGGLLWSLEIEGWHHRLGYAKPLGFGSANIQITGLELIEPASRYLTVQIGAGWTQASERKEEWIQLFKQSFGSSFENLPTVQDLRALLAETPSLPVHYPRPTRQPHPEGRNYEWFVGNKRSGRDAGPRLVLPLATDDHDGFPLLDRFGREQGVEGG